MATSGSKNFSVTRADLIETALRKLGTHDQGEAISGDETTAAALALNLIVKELTVEGADIFLRAESILFLQPDTVSYDLTTAEITDAITAETTLSAAEASGQTVISVTSSTGMTAADRVGIKIDDNTIHWTTIVSVDSATQITITVATDGAAASGNKVYTYTTKSDKPQKILFAFRRDVNDFDTEIALIGSSEYFRQSNKKSDGPPVEVWYNPQGNTSVGKVHVWPDNGGATWDKVVLITQVLADDMDVSTDNPDFPIEWANALVWRLAAELSFEYGIPNVDRQGLWAIANAKIEDALSYDTENASVIFAQDTNR